MIDVEKVCNAVKSVPFSLNGRTLCEDAGLDDAEIGLLARAAIRATIEQLAEGLRAEVMPRGATYEARMGVDVAADWLLDQAKGLDNG